MVNSNPYAFPKHLNTLVFPSGSELRRLWCLRPPSPSPPFIIASSVFHRSMFAFVASSDSSSAHCNIELSPSSFTPFVAFRFPFVADGGTYRPRATAAATTDADGPTSELHRDPPCCPAAWVGADRSSSGVTIELPRSDLTRQSMLPGSVLARLLSSAPTVDGGMLTRESSSRDTAMFRIPCGRPDGRRIWSATALRVWEVGWAGMI
uniref:Uncharacterized protein n=1 Tax=Opuntia streptacantha TaxID=393608 RepID=A0A7C8YPC0_OPUST